MSYNFRTDNGIEKISTTFEDGCFIEMACVLDSEGNVDVEVSKIRLQGYYEFHIKKTLSEKHTTINKEVNNYPMEEI